MKSEVVAGKRAKSTRGMTFLAAVKDQVDRLSPPGSRQPGALHQGRAAGNESTEAREMLARFDSAIASLAGHEDDPQMANTLAEKKLSVASCS